MFRKIALSFVVGGVVLAAVGLGASGQDVAKVSGSLTGSGDKLGSWTVVPAMCQTGETHGKPEAALHLVFDHPRTPSNPSGGPVFVDIGNSPAWLDVAMPLAIDEPLHFDEKVCKTLRINLAAGEDHFFRVKTYSGSLDADCAVDGNQLRGHLEFKNCKL